MHTEACPDVGDCWREELLSFLLMCNVKVQEQSWIFSVLDVLWRKQILREIGYLWQWFKEKPAPKW